MDNLNAFLDGGSPRWIPFSLDVGANPGLTPPVMRRFVEKTGASDPAEYFDFDWRTFSLTTHFGGQDPTRYHQAVEPGTTFDEWGIGHSSSSVEATLDRSYPPLRHVETVHEVESYPSPIIDQPADISRIADYHARGYPVFGYAGSIYEWSWWLRGMEEFLAGMLLEPDLTEAICDKVTEHTRRLALASARIGIDVLCFYDDAGMQSGMQISPQLWRKYVKPRWRRVLDDVRRQFPQVRTFLHSCGKITEIVPDIVDLGFDMLHPLQPECMDFAAIRRQFGKHIALCATISAQRILPFGSPEDVRREVRRLKQVCADDRRCILCPSNLIQPETPWDNLLAFAEEASADRH